MIDDVNHTENSQAPTSESPESLEELHEEDASVEIDFDVVEDEGAGSEAAAAAADMSTDPTSDQAAEVGAGAEHEPTAATSAVVADLERQVEGLKAQLEDRTGQYMRIAADFENYRKRTSKEKEDLEGQIKGNTVVELLPVVDNFERARSQIKPQTEAEMTIHKSYQGVYKQLVDCLKKLGVSAMRSEGQEFDPNLHEAVMREPTDQYPEGTVIEEFLRGYQLGDRVLRHAMVKVAAPPESSSETPETDSAVTEG